ncbi:cytochrome P450 [Rhizobium sp. TRM95001]|nr:cytochrome P450 [Rhizobium halophilum]
MQHAPYEEISAPAEYLPLIKTAELEADAHQAFRRWRGRAPIAVHEGGPTFVLRYADVERLSSDPRLRATETGIAQQRGLAEGALYDFFEHGMLTANGESHERRRLPMSRAMASRLVNEVRSHTRECAETLIDDLSKERQSEFVSSFAALLPVYTLARVLGIPRGDEAVFSHDVLQLSKFFRPDSTDRDTAASTTAAENIYEYLKDLVQARRENPATDLVSAFASATDDGALSEVQIISQLVQLLIGGTESVRATIVAMTANLLLKKDQWRAVCQSPKLIPAAVKETMRYEPGIAGLVRIVAEPIEIGRSLLSPGSLVVLSIMSAMRDETVFPAPDVFNIHRDVSVGRNLGFGSGAHRCVAEALAQAELEETLAVLTRRLPSLRLEEIPVLKGFIFTRDPTSMCVSW